MVNITDELGFAQTQLTEKEKFELRKKTQKKKLAEAIRTAVLHYLSMEV